MQTVKRRTQTIGGTGITPVSFLTVASTVAVTLGATSTFSFTLPAGAPALVQVSEIALYESDGEPANGLDDVRRAGDHERESIQSRWRCATVTSISTTVLRSRGRIPT